MTREELKAILEQFAICVLSTSISDLTPDDQHNLIQLGIDAIADTVMIYTDKSRAVCPSAN